MFPKPSVSNRLAARVSTSPPHRRTAALAMSRAALSRCPNHQLWLCLSLSLSSLMSSFSRYPFHVVFGSFGDERSSFPGASTRPPKRCLPDYSTVILSSTSYQPFATHPLSELVSAAVESLLPSLPLLMSSLGSWSREKSSANQGTSYSGLPSMSLSSSLSPSGSGHRGVSRLRAPGLPDSRRGRVARGRRTIFFFYNFIPLHVLTVTYPPRCET